MSGHADLRKSLLRPWRLRFLLFALGLAVLYALVEALFWREIPSEMRTLTLALGGFSLLLSYGLLFWLYHSLTQDLLQPLMALGRDLEAQTHAGAQIDESEYHNSLIAPFVGELVREESEKHDQGASENWLSELLHVIDQGLIVATVEHEVLLVNSRTREMVGPSASLALGRSLKGLVDVETIDHAIKRQMSEDAVGSERLFCRFLKDDQIMPARLSLLNTKTGEILGYVLAFNDISNALYRTQELETAFDRLLEDARAFAGEITVLSTHNLPIDEAQSRFHQALAQHKADGQELLGQAWPKGRMTLRNLLRVLGERVENIEMSEPPERIFIRCDGAAIIETLEHLLIHLQQQGYTPRLDCEIKDDHINMVISSGDQRIAMRHVEELMRRALAKLPTAPTGHEVLRAHSTEIWPQETDNKTHLAFLLKRIKTARSLSEARPDYYDFEPKIPQVKMSDTPLRNLAIVVFDSETTGLDPKGGDEVVQLSAVRVKSGKVIADENFDELVNPGRNIPAASTKIHHITNEMVKDAPHFDVVAKDFHGFCHGEVLLAHNAAFDMAFLRKGGARAGVEFDQPVLDTVFMSAFLFDYTGQHTLDDLARRFGIIIPENARHTALGDALATAEIFAKMLPMLEARGVETLGQMIEIGEQMRSIRKRQEVYG